VLAGLVSALLAGCAKQTQEGQTPTTPAKVDPNAVRKPATAAKPRVALIMKSLANEFFKTMEDGAKAHQQEHADEYELICNGIKDEEDVNGQIEIVNQMLAQKVDALVIAPADSTALIPVCKKARDAGLVVVNIDNKFDDEALKKEQVSLPFVGPNNRTGAKLAGDYLAKQLTQGDGVAIIEGKPGAFNAIQRKLGFVDAMKAAGMKILTSQSAYWETDKAYPLVDQIHNKYGAALKAVLCANDSMALGAVRALQGKRVKVVGFDNISAVQSLIKEGKVVCTIDQHADQIAVNGIVHALEILKSGETPKDKETPVDLITAETLMEKG
jgi:ribose transport system substrate-binding protein